MNPEEYTRMFDLEDHYWWFVGRRRLALRLLANALGVAGKGAYRAEGDKPSVLDLGCGTGAVAQEMSAWAEPVGVDMSALALIYCRRRSIHRLVQADGERLPFQSDSVDGVLGLDIFEHIADDNQAFRESYRVLKPGGALVLSVPAFKSLWGPHDVALMHHRRYRKGEVERQLRAAGFQVERLSYSVFFLFPVVVAVRILEKRRRGDPRASLVPLPRWANQGLVGLQLLESRMIARASLPWGSSVIAVGRKSVGG